MKAAKKKSSPPPRVRNAARSRRRPARGSLRDAAYEAIKYRIITCAFKPGESVNELQLSALLKIGRTPVHQALDRLMVEDMVEVIPRKGVIVKPVIMQDVMQMIDVRMVNETYCARLAAAHANDTHIKAMAAMLREARSAIAKHDIHAMMTLDGAFHRELAAASGNVELAEILRRLNERSLRFWFISFDTADHHSSFQKQHEAILAAIRDRDAAGAEAAMGAHIEAFRRSVARHL
jgi:DNA-binding GntR family transcriptional regulator